jgi:glycerol-3-phosphate dehydrogenase (NAD(P)+)
MDRERIAVIPAGAFGTAMGMVAARNGHDVKLYVQRDSTLQSMREGRNPRLPGVDLPEAITVTNSLQKALDGATTIVFAAPSHITPRFAEQLARAVDGSPYRILSLTKGLHTNHSHEVRTTTRMLRSLMPSVHTAAESGPNFAEVVAKGEVEVATVIASENDTRFVHADTFGTDMLRVETSDDEVGVQIAGASKNVYAVAVGMCEGLGMSRDELSQVVAHGPMEMAALGAVFGAKKETFYGTAGKGDLELTCTPGSRNYRAGLRLGRGEVDVGELFRQTIAANQVVEGVHAALGIKLIAQQHNLDLPVINAITGVLHDGLLIEEAVARIRRAA